MFFRAGGRACAGIPVEIRSRDSRRQHSRANESEGRDPESCPRYSQRLPAVWAGAPQRSDGREFRFVVVSGERNGDRQLRAQQTDTLQLFHDWLGLLNRGVQVTPIGASDSHDVSRFTIGQGRTYIQCNDEDPGNIDVKEAASNVVAGRVLVSCGLLVKLTVNETYVAGDLVPAGAESRATITVLGPSWVEARDVAIYANGERIRDGKISSGRQGGVKWTETWTLPRFKHDVHLTAVATGPGVTELYWPIARPYQPMSIDVNRQVIGASGAVWLDADGDGKRTSAFEYASRIVGDGSRGISEYHSCSLTMTKRWPHKPLVFWRRAGRFDRHGRSESRGESSGPASRVRVSDILSLLARGGDSSRSKSK